MGVPINNVTRRVVYAASGTGPYNFTFEILAAGDIAVYKDDALLTLTTDYSVTINSNGTGFVTLTATPTGATQIAIVGNRTISRTTDFVTGGDFFANTLNDELDQQTIFNQQNSEGLSRALQAPQTDPTSINMTLPRASLRANKALGFDANGNPAIADTLGTNRGNWAAATLYYVRDIVKDTTNNNIWQCITQHTSTGSQPINTNTDSAKWTLLVDAAAASTSATNAANSATLSSQWASQVSGIVDSTDYSAKAWSIGGTGVTSTSSRGAAKEWATKTSGTVDTADYSAKEYAQGTQSSTGGSAKNWAQQTGADVTGASANSRSAKSWAQDSLTGSTLGGSSKDWAQYTGGTVNGTEYSAKYYSQESASSASLANDWATKTSSAVAGGEFSAKYHAQAASTSASNASTSATNASNSATAAANSATSAASSFDSFDDRYLGAKSSAPSVDNDGNALLTGALYWNTTGNQLYVWTGSAWNAAAFTASGGVVQTSSTGSAVIPSGTDAQRDGSPSAGYFRFNTDSDSFEGYDGTAWGAIGGGGATTLTVTNRSGSGVSVPLTNGFLAVTNRAGSTVNVPVT